MTASGDGLEDLLRQALTAAVSEVQPSGDGLGKILAQTSKRPPRPWALSMLAGIAQRARYWTWRGHWAWPQVLPSVAGPPFPRLHRVPLTASGDAGLVRSGNGRPGNAGSSIAQRLGLTGVGWMRPVVALAGIVVIIGVSLGVQPVRQVIIQASNNVLSGGSTKTGGAGTEGHAKPAGNGGQPAGSAPAPTADGSASPVGSASVTTADSAAAAPSPTSPVSCPPVRLTGWTVGENTASSPVAAPASSANATPPNNVPGDKAAAPAGPTPIPSSPAYYSTATPTATATPTCAAPSPTAITPPAAPPTSSSSSPSLSPTPTPTPTTSSPTPAPTGTSTTGSPLPTPTGSQSPSPTPTGTPASGSPSPTATASSTVSPTPSDSGSDGGDGTGTTGTGPGANGAQATPLPTPSPVVGPS